MFITRYHIVYAYIEHFLEKHNMSVDEFCKNIGIYKETLYLLKMKNVQQFPLICIFKICQYTGIPFNKLIIDLEDYS